MTEKRNEELGTVLGILRMVRGFSQHDLAGVSGLRAGTISDYERGKMVPGVNTVKKLLDGMSYSFTDLDKAQRFIAALGRESLYLAELPVLKLSEGNEALEREIAATATAAGKVATCIVQLAFTLLAAPSASGSAVPDALCKEAFP